MRSNIKNDIDDIVQRLMEIAQVTEYKELAEKHLYTSKNTFSSWKNQNKRIPIDTLIDFAKAKQVSLDWIITGKKPKGGDCEEKNGYLTIPYYGRVDEGGKAPDIDTIKKTIPSKNITVPIDGVSRKYIHHNLVAVRTKGVAMPKSAPKDSLLICDLTDHALAGSCDFFIIETDSGAHLKKVIFTAERGKFILKSENRSIDDWVLNEDEFRVVGKVLGVFRYDVH